LIQLDNMPRRLSIRLPQKKTPAANRGTIRRFQVNPDFKSGFESRLERRVPMVSGAADTGAACDVQLQIQKAATLVPMSARGRIAGRVRGQE
jgi:hypothetical protein